mmetsp:Transcript_19038/g.27963  ORF Transcript_19038/g.27963 Transcript_19038/m.27963 type:complete len:1413 (+) Transcript_19038:197-4435(+)
MTDPGLIAADVWQKVQSAAASTENVATAAVNASTADFNAQFLASALRVGGDAQYFEESISPTTVKNELSTADPSNPTYTATMLRGMKWLLASLSKGRDVSDFFPHVVKLVEAKSLEVRKMVYVYLVRYADHDVTCRELSLLSINSFQRGLAAPEPLIRALALRVLSSIRVPDVLQIQIMGVQKCAKDHSPYVRKCAANALAKLCPRCDPAQRESLMSEVITTMLDSDSSTMVLTSAIIAFSELCPDRLEMLHASYRKLCHLLTDMDEWGQVVAMDVLSRYCRRFFREPQGAKMGSAVMIDRERRIRRTSAGVVAKSVVTDTTGDALDVLIPMNEDKKKKKKSKNDAAVPLGMGIGSVAPSKIKRRVVKKAFYSDEEDESEEEEVYASHPLGAKVPVAGAMRQRSVLGFGVSGNNVMGGGLAGQSAMDNQGDDEDEDLHEDHKLLLRSSLSLLMSRNAAVVLAVCSLHYYCGVASIKIRSAIGKALVRIHRDRREIQYVVLTSIRSLVSECPSAFTPFLDDFFIKAMDPSFTRMIKLNILVDLSLEPASIRAVLKELRSYVRHDDKEFVCASIRTVGKLAELARIVFDRHGAKATANGGGDRCLEDARREANEIALNCLYGLMVLTECRQDEKIVGECVMVMQRIISQLLSGSGEDAVTASKNVVVEDPNSVQSMALRRLVLLLVQAISSVSKESNEEAGGGDDADDEVENGNEPGGFTQRSVALPATAVGPALWIVGEWLTNSSCSSIPIFNMDGDVKSHMKSELLRLLAKSFPDLNPYVKVQGVHFACKAFIASKEGPVSSKKRTADDVALCEHILAMGRVDVHQDVRDRSRFESHVLHLSVGLSLDIDALPAPPASLKKMTIFQVKAMLLHQKPPPSYLPLDEDEGIDGNKKHHNLFRFGTLSSLISHKAGQEYLQLPPWAEKDSPSSLRDPPAPEQQQQQKMDGDGWNASKKKNASSFYESDEESSTSEESSSDESSSEGEESSSSGSESDDEESTSSEEESSEEESSEGEDSDSSDEESDDEESEVSNEQEISKHTAMANGGGVLIPPPQQVVDSDESSSEDEDSSSESSSDEEVSESEQKVSSNAAVGSLLPLGGLETRPPPIKKMSSQASDSSSIAEGFQGLVMSPIVVSQDSGERTGPADVEEDTSAWKHLVRPEIGGGLLVKARYLRGKTRSREAKVMGLDPSSVTVVCLQINFENRRTDTGTLRHVRLMQRGGGGSGTIPPRRVIIPPEISVLKKGQMSSVILGINFSSSSDKDGAFLARLDAKSDKGSNPIEIRVPVGELIQQCLINRADFEKKMESLKGIHQRVVSSIMLSASSNGKSAKEIHKDLPDLVIKHSTLTPVENKLGWQNNVCSFVGKLPVSGDHVCVTITCDPNVGSGEIVVCSNNAIVSNAILGLLKSAIEK